VSRKWILFASLSLQHTKSGGGRVVPLLVPTRAWVEEWDRGGPPSRTATRAPLRARMALMVCPLWATHRPGQGGGRPAGMAGSIAHLGKETHDSVWFGKLHTSRWIRTNGFGGLGVWWARARGAYKCFVPGKGGGLVTRRTRGR